MKKTLIILSIALVFAFSLFCDAPQPESPRPTGHLVIIGGGKRPDSIMKKFIELSNGFEGGKILVLPMASSVPFETGPGQADQMKQLGAKDVSFLHISREQASQDSIIAKLNGITGIFFSGGSQSRLMKVIRDTPFADKIRELYMNGAAIGGTSAGAAIMSAMMITGDEIRPLPGRNRAFSKIESHNIVTETGLGLVEDVIIDQHFIRRKRHNRLISLVLENPDLVGIGIDESTALIVKPNNDFEVIGEGSIIFYDARNAGVAPIDTTATFNLEAHGIKMHILGNGSKINLQTNEIYY